MNSDGILVAFRNRDLVDARAFVRLRLNPVEECSERISAGLGESPRLFNHETVPTPLLPRSGPVKSGFHEEAITNKFVGQSRRRHHHSFSVIH